MTYLKRQIVISNREVFHSEYLNYIVRIWFPENYSDPLWIYILNQCRTWNQVWLAEGLCLLLCNATWWSSAFSAGLFPHMCHLKISKLLWTGIWWEEVFGEHFSFSVLLLLVLCCYWSNYKVPCKKHKRFWMTKDNSALCCMFWLLLFQPWTTFIMTLKLIMSVRACRHISFLPLWHRKYFCITVDGKENLFVQVEKELIYKAAFFFLI